MDMKYILTLHRYEGGYKLPPPINAVQGVKFNHAENRLGHTLLRHTFLFIVYLICERININAYKKTVLNLLNKNNPRIVSFRDSNSN